MIIFQYTIHLMVLLVHHLIFDNRTNVHDYPMIYYSLVMVDYETTALIIVEFILINALYQLYLVCTKINYLISIYAYMVSTNTWCNAHIEHKLIDSQVLKNKKREQ